MRAKNFITACSTILVVAAMTMSCSKSDSDAVMGEIPVVKFDTEQTVFNITAMESVTINAEILSEGSPSCRWLINGVLEESGTKFDHVFETAGIYEVKFVARNGQGETWKTFTVTVEGILEIELSIGDVTEITRNLGDELRVMANVISGENVNHEWTVNGEQKSTEELLAFMLESENDYEIAYRGWNNNGDVNKTFTVKIISPPLEINFSMPQGAIAQSLGATLSLTATVKYGGGGLQHSWKVAGVEKSTTNTLNYVCDMKGTFTVTYYGKNAKDEEVNASWTLTVSQQYMFDNFESYSISQPLDAVVNFTGTNRLSAVTNPDKTGINPSDKAMKVAVFLTANNYTSGYFDMNIGASFVDNPAQHKGIRLKIYRFSDNPVYYPRLNINGGGNPMPSVTNPTKMDEWETIEFMFDPKDTGTAGGYTRHTIRPFLTASGGNAEAPVDMTFTILIDDIEFIPVD